jgi:superfamily II DNA or RNA helicase
MAVLKGSRVLFLAHRRELLSQAADKLEKLGLDFGIIQGNHWRTDARKPIQVASIQTLTRRKNPPAQLIIVDECHRTLSPTLLKTIESYPSALVLGLTATPYRLDNKPLSRVYQDLVVTSPIKDLVSAGYLVAPRVFAPHRPDLAGVHSLAGDYRHDELAEKMDKARLVGDIVVHWKRIANGRKTVVFAAGVEHSKHIAEMFRNAGVLAEHVDGTMAMAGRDAMLSRLNSGQTTVLCNSDLLVEGWDLPALSCCILARPTKSTARYVQQVGRIMRACDGKQDAILLDHAGSVFVHGFPTDERAYSLDDQERRPDDEEAPVKICRECFAVMLSTARVCPECGAAVVEERTGRKAPETQDGELAEIVPGDLVTCRRCRSPNTRTFKGRGLGAFTTGLQCLACGAASFVTDHLRAHAASREEKAAEWRRLEEIRVRKGFKSGWSSWRYRSLFGVWPRGVKSVDAPAPAGVDGSP